MGDSADYYRGFCLVMSIDESELHNHWISGCIYTQLRRGRMSDTWVHTYQAPQRSDEDSAARTGTLYLDRRFAQLESSSACLTFSVTINAQFAPVVDVGGATT